MHNELSQRDLVSRPDNMDKTVLHTHHRAMFNELTSKHSHVTKPKKQNS